jgi:hypothetical protein
MMEPLNCKMKQNDQGLMNILDRLYVVVFHKFKALHNMDHNIEVRDNMLGQVRVDCSISHIMDKRVIHNNCL